MGAMRTMVAVDWGKEAAKRAAFVARSESNGLSVAPLEPPSGGWNLHALLAFARDEALRVKQSVLIGIDAVLGLPREYLSLADLGDGAGFLEFVRRTTTQPALLADSGTGPWNPTSPFFAVPKGKGAFLSFVAAAGGRARFWRRVEERTRANPVFALSGIPGTVGSGSRALWRELSRCMDVDERDFAVWPFEGVLHDAFERAPIVLAEVYPRAAYALALCDALPVAPVHVAKTKPSARAAALRMLHDARWPAEIGLAVAGLDRAAANEDYFDALMTALALTRLAASGRLGESDFSDPICEGDILGVAALDFQGRTLTITGARESRPVQMPKRAPACREERGAPAREILCPIADCRHAFTGGRGGWDAHVGSYRRHPAWHPELRDAEDRRSRFRIEFADWFR